MEKIILFRKWENSEEEFKIAKKYLSVSESRVGLSNKLVIGRYSVLPYYEELEKDLESQGSKLINTYHQHQFIADFLWYHFVREFTPKTYFGDYGVPQGIPDKGPFVVKGTTNSRKFEWNTKMFARTREEALNIALELSQDSLIRSQGTIIREYVPLKTYELGINGLPFSNEWRFFYLGSKRLCYAYYWSIAQKRGEMSQEGLDFADNIAKIISRETNFFVLDIAEKQEGGWILIEINDGQMSGLSENNPEELYKSLCLLI